MRPLSRPPPYADGRTEGDEGEQRRWARGLARGLEREREGSLPNYAIDWARGEPRAIYRAASLGFTGTLDGEPVSLPGFGVGERVLEATQAWEGSAVFDPCPRVLADARLRLYYAAARGIGVPEAYTPGAALTRVGDGPILGPDPNIAASSVPRSPAVVGAIVLSITPASQHLADEP